MNWYLAKIIYQIVCDKGAHTPQFDEQLRLISAEDDLHAFHKARQLGEQEEDSFTNQQNKPVCWKFIDVSEMHKLNNLVDGAEMYSVIKEENDSDRFISNTKMRARKLFETCMEETVKLN
ncbi:MAG: DUF4288 domain-containing protein [Ferruginibacter sp.]